MFPVFQVSKAVASNNPDDTIAKTTSAFEKKTKIKAFQYLFKSYNFLFISVQILNIRQKANKRKRNRNIYAHSHTQLPAVTTDYSTSQKQPPYFTPFPFTAIVLSSQRL